jgi:hypothetical protein
MRSLPWILMARICLQLIAAAAEAKEAGIGTLIPRPPTAIPSIKGDFERSEEAVAVRGTPRDDYATYEYK